MKRVGPSDKNSELGIGQILAPCDLTNVQFSMLNSYPKKPAPAMKQVGPLG
jgi:hypothetical protein